MMQILIAEDDPLVRRIMREALEQAGHEVRTVADGQQALAELDARPADVLITDWMMPRLDGIELIRRVRRGRHAPVIIMHTAIDSADSRSHALSSGADDFVKKPCRPRVLQHVVELCVKRRQQRAEREQITLPPPSVRPSFSAVGVASSTGGPKALAGLFGALPSSARAAFFIVQHGLAWMLEQLKGHLETSMPVFLAEDGMPIRTGEVYLAPGDHHTRVDDGGEFLVVEEGPPENSCRPSVDPLFRSLARVFRSRATGVVLTGLGCDGCAGSQWIAAGGGAVLVQQRDECVAPFMPKAVLQAGVRADERPVGQLADALSGRLGLVPSR